MTPDSVSHPDALFLSVCLFNPNKRHRFSGSACKVFRVTGCRGEDVGVRGDKNGVFHSCGPGIRCPVWARSGVAGRSQSGEDWEDGVRGWMQVKHFICGRCPLWLRAAPPDWSTGRWRSAVIGQRHFSLHWPHEVSSSCHKLGWKLLHKTFNCGL